MRVIWLFRLTFILMLLLTSTLFAQTPHSARIAGFTITADSLSRDLDKNMLFLEGNVTITYKEQHFSAQYVEVNFNKKIATLKGQVRIVTPEAEIGGEEIQLDYLSDQSLILNGYVQSNNIRFQGRYLEQQSQKEFFVLNADYTTCSNCPATWSFDGTQIKAELGGYAFIKNAFLRVGGVPIFWLPYLMVPLKNERQSGLLNPEFGYIQNRKFVFNQSLFWAIDRSQDMTFTLKNYELGGLKQLVEYRYALSEQSFGQVNAAHMSDNLFRSSSRYNYFRDSTHQNDSFNRWSLKSYQQNEISDIQKIRMNLNLVSDLQYPKDFFDEFKTYSDSGLENSISYTHTQDHTLFNLNATYFRHLLEANPLADNSAAVHKLPELKIDSTLQRISTSPFYYKVSFEGTQFYRTKSYDDISTDTEGQKYVSNQSNNPRCDNTLSPNSTSDDCIKTDDGVFDDDKDLIRTGQRLLLKSSLTTETATIGSAVNITPQLTYSLSQYYFPVGQERENSRQYLQFDVLSRSKLYRIYESKDDTDSEIKRKFKHEFIPELSYTWIPWIEQDSHPFFGNTVGSEAPFSSRSIISDSDLKNNYGVQYDYEDRLYDRHLLTLTLLNRVIRKKISDSSYKTVFDFRLSQSYDLYQSTMGINKGQPLSDLVGNTNLYLEEFTISNQFNYYPYLSATNSSTTLTYLNSSQQYFKVGYISKRTEDPKQDDVSFAIGFVTNYINLLTGVIIDTSENRQSDSRLKKHSLIAQLKPPGECWAVNFYRDQKVGLDAEWKVRFDFSFDGKPTKVIPPAELNIN